MALVRKSTSGKKVVVLLVVFFVLLAAGLVYFFGFASSQGSNEETDLTIKQLETIYANLHAVDQNLLPDLQNLYTDERFQELKPYGSLPVDVGSLGRKNPFSHF